jgi:hypothetical protein
LAKITKSRLIFSIYQSITLTPVTWDTRLLTLSIQNLFLNFMTSLMGEDGTDLTAKKFAN